MGTRKPTIEGLDDVDDQDGTAEEERSAETDLSLHRKDERDVGLGRTPPDRDPYIEDDEGKPKRED